MSLRPAADVITRLFAGAREGNVAAVSGMLRDGDVKASCVDSMGDTVLMAAAGTRDIYI